MMKRIAEGASRIFLACGYTDFRKQIPGLVATVTLSFKLDPYNGSYVFIFCNRRRDSIKVLRYDQNGFVLATKKLDDMKFQWPRKPDEVKEITFQQIEWLLQGLEIEQKKSHHQVKIDHKIKCTLCQGHYDFFLFRFLLYICLLCRGIKEMPLIDCFHLLL